MSGSGEMSTASASLKESFMTDLLLSLVQDDAAIASLLFDQSSKTKTLKKNGTSNKGEHQKLLLGACQHLFQSIEKLSKTLQQVESSTTKNDFSNDNNNQNTSSLSGLDELYLGEKEDNNNNNNANGVVDVVDAETVWGQVDLQNDALHAILKKSVKTLGQAAAADSKNDIDNNRIRLLDLDSEILKDDDDDDNACGDNSEEGEESDDKMDSNDEDGNESEEDEVARRMRERMERALASDDDDDVDDEEDVMGSGSDDEEFEDTRFFGAKKNVGKSSTPSNNKPQEKKDEFEGEDPAAEELNNGFFDINEMEAFADEEEDMLPEDVWEPTPDTIKKKSKHDKSFHQRQREGIDDDNEEDDSDDDNDSGDEEEMMEMRLASAKRKKYREDDEVEALHGMYGSSKMTGDDELGIDDNDYGEDAINMTAADLFGKPDKKYFHKWKSQQQSPKSTDKMVAAKSGDGDDDSWDGYNFDNEDADWGDSKEKEGKSTEKANESDSENDSDSKSDDDSEEDEEVEMADKMTDKPPAKLSRHERQSEKLQEETKKLEQEMIGAKPWQMVGEASSSARPINSLLDGAPEFQVASKIAPLITEEHTADLEEVIKRRIIADDWDDVIPRELPDVAWNKKRGELPEVSQEKAKLGLGELYEREYLKKAVGYDVDAAEKESEEDKAKSEMKQLFANVCSKLDALSNYHFAPRPVADEAEVRIATTPAIAMEEVLPLHVSDARGAAPEEVYGKKRGRDGILRSETELEQTERKRIRSGKKAARRKTRKDKAADAKLISRVQPGLGLNNPYEKRKAQEEVSMARAEGRIKDGQQDLNSGYGSSVKFFQKLQEEVSQTVHGERAPEVDQKKESRAKKSSTFKM